VQELSVSWTQKHQIDADFAWIIVSILILLIKLENLGVFKVKLVNIKFSKIFQVPEKRSSSPGAGTCTSGWETLL